MSCPVPGESIFNSTNNHINLIAYKKLCNEFNISAGSDFRYKGGDSGGLGTMYNYMPGQGYGPLKMKDYDPPDYQFTGQSTVDVTKIDYISQCDALEGWKQFILKQEIRSMERVSAQCCCIPYTIIEIFDCNCNDPELGWFKVKGHGANR